MTARRAVATADAILSKNLTLGNAKVGEKGGDDPRDGPSAFACYGVTGRTVAMPRAQKLRVESSGLRDLPVSN